MYKIFKTRAIKVELDNNTPKRLYSALIVKKIGKKFLIDPNFRLKNLIIIQMMTEKSWLETMEKLIFPTEFTIMFPILSNDSIRN